MYTYHELSIKPLLVDIPIRMPVKVLLALPDYITSDSNTKPFNLPAAINDLMGSSGWKRAVKVMDPRVWAPGWSNAQLRSFVTAPFGSKDQPFPEQGLKKGIVPEYLLFEELELTIRLCPYSAVKWRGPQEGPSASAYASEVRHACTTYKVSVGGGTRFTQCPQFSLAAFPCCLPPESS